MALVQTLISGVGPLPQTVKFTALGDGPVVFYLSGSAWSTISGTNMSVSLSLDGAVIGSASVCSNEAVSHKALVPVFIPVDLEGMDHVLTLEVTSSDTVTDLNDNFQVMLMY